MSRSDTWLASAVVYLLDRAADGDTEGVKNALEDIVTECDARGVWALCCFLAQTVTSLGLGVEQGQGFAAVQLEWCGQPVEPEDVPPHAQPHLWASRFVAAYTNGDMQTTVALFRSTMHDPELHMAGVASLIGMAAQVMRADCEHDAGDGHECS